MDILLIDDHDLVRQGIGLILAEAPQDFVLHEARDFTTGCQLLANKAIDIVLLDYYLPDKSGLQAFDELRVLSDAKIVILSSENNPTIIERVIDRGADGFITKDSSSDVLLAALNLVMAGGTYTPPRTKKAQPYAQPSQWTEQLQDPEIPLSKRQREVLELAMQGTSNKVIARALDLAEGTVKAHLSSAYRSLGVKNRTEAALVFTRFNKEE